MEAHGFEHSQYSGYMSKEPIRLTTVIRLLEEMEHELPWLEGCWKECDVTEVGESFSFLEWEGRDADPHHGGDGDKAAAPYTIPIAETLEGLRDDDEPDGPCPAPER